MQDQSVVSGFLQLGGPGRVAVTDLRKAAETLPLRKPRNGHKAQIAAEDLPAVKSLVVRQHDLVLVRAYFPDKGRASEGNAEAFALSDGIMNNAPVLSQHMSLRVDESPLPGKLRPGMFLNVRSVIAVRDKADLLRIALVRDGKPRRFRDPPHLLLGELRERHHRP